MRTFLSFGLLFLLAVGVAEAQSTGESATASTPPRAQVSELMTKALKDYPGKEGTMILVTYPPGAVDPVHRHYADAFVYVLEGSIVMGLNGGKNVTLGPGQTFYEGPDDVHTVGRNASRTKPAKFVVFLLKDQNKPVLVPVH
ncbi:cupin domain-containing protein [Dyella nitratireducens]|uniref:Cupin n=1 Tax=Dyella nitratireducens TaxID=1849580 RepID=A0ABQ1FX87_9GAMM|nr:cupin domain-containing protein [Dyella nitratireducens]GGA32359.1 cupin [Dyella nitratireducens]GLQ42754.1 cupin [Dyella nitratireducens]